MEQKRSELVAEQVAERDDYIESVREAVCGRGLRVYVRTFGCQQNEADSELLEGMANRMGYESTSSPDLASLIIVNTCAVREHAEKKALSVIGQYKHCKARNPELIIAICGCMPSQESRANELKYKYPYVDFSFGTSEIHRLPELLFKRLNGGGRVFLLPPAEPRIAEGMPAARAHDYRAWVSIMYGCNNFCSYCIVPYVRGRERSRSPEAIKDEVRCLVASGCRDVTLLGQNVNSYGKGLDTDCNFATLLESLAEIDGDFKLHFMTSHPKDATRELIDVMARSPRVAKQLHLPAQSGSDKILARMNRRYTVEKYMEIVDYARSKMPSVVLTTDIIVGFPGETETDFEATLELLRRVEYDMVYSFIYSPRRGTPAAEMPDQVPPEVKSERLERLIALQTRISAEKNAAEVGKTLRVLCCGASKNDADMLEGRTEGNKIVLFAGSPELEGHYVDVIVKEARAYAMYGDAVSKKTE